MDKQEVFNKVKTHLLTQMKKSIGPKPEGCFAPYLGPEIICLYRGPDNTKCAIGCLIPDDKYSIALENKTSFSIVSDGIIPRLNDSNFYYSLQQIHDVCDPAQWATQLAEFAKENGLEP